MKGKHNSKLEMYSKVNEVLVKNLDKFENVQQLKRTAETFQKLRNDILTMKEDSEKDLSFIVDAKIERRNDLISHVLPIANIAEVFLSDNKQQDSRKKVKLSKNSLSKINDNGLIEKSETVWKVAKKQYAKSSISNDENAHNITDYGITGQMLDHLEEIINQFISAVLDEKDAFAYRQKCGQDVNGKIKKANTLLKKRMDKLLSLYELSDPKFYQSYKAARKGESRLEEKITPPTKTVVNVDKMLDLTNGTNTQTNNS